MTEKRNTGKEKKKENKKYPYKKGGHNRIKNEKPNRNKTSNK